MAYMAQGSLDLGDLAQMKALFAANSWTWATAVSTMLFSLMHWPCSTTLLTIKKNGQLEMDRAGRRAAHGGRGPGLHGLYRRRAADRS